MAIEGKESSRRDFLRVMGIGGMALALPNLLRAAGGKTNVLFFFVDDLRPQLGCYGSKTVLSPNIDGLAREGTLFEKAYCSQAVCSPSRLCTLTGQRPDETGIYDLDHPLRAGGSTVTTLPQHFKERGYETLTMGKVYHHPADDRENWTFRAKIAEPHYADLGTGTEAQPAGGGKMKGAPTQCVEAPDSAFGDGRVADEAVGQLKRFGSGEKKNTPFFMCVGFRKPHLPFSAPKKYWDLYDRSLFPVPAKETPKEMPAIALQDFGELRAYTDIPKVGPVDDDQAKELIHGYHACVSFTDAMVGRVLNELSAQGLAGNTLVVLWGDHGWKLGEYGSWCKHSNFELDTHLPLLMKGPGVRAGQRVGQVVEMIDVFPTLADLTGGTAPGTCSGASMRNLLAKGRDEGWKDLAVSQWPRVLGGEALMGYSLRTGVWRYTEWVKKSGDVHARELYRHDKGDVATENLAEDPSMADTMAKFSAALTPYRKTKWAAIGKGGTGKE